MGWNPVSAQLGRVLEEEEFFYTITYTDLLGVNQAVTITTNMPNPTVTVTSNTIYGYFTEVFTSNTIVYLSRDRQDIATSSWANIDTALRNSSILEIYDWSPDPTPSKTYYYTARAANGDTKEYNIVVLNNWDNGKNRLLYYLDRTRRVYVPRYGQVDWINNDAQIVIWLNDNIENSSVTWINGP